MAGAMSKNMICLTNRKTFLMKFIQSRLKNNIKIKVIEGKKLSLQILNKCTVEQKKPYRDSYKISRLILGHLLSNSALYEHRCL